MIAISVNRSKCMHERLLQIQSHSCVILKIQLYFLLSIIHHIRLIDIKFEKFNVINIQSHAVNY